MSALTLNGLKFTKSKVNDSVQLCNKEVPLSMWYIMNISLHGQISTKLTPG